MAEDADVLLDAISRALAESDDVEGSVFVTAYVVLAAFTDTDGEQAVFTATADNQRAHESLGLLAFATATENARVMRESDG